MARWILGWTAFLLLLDIVVALPAAGAIMIDMVTVGNPGNAPDTRYATPGYGSVAYTYQIGKYEVTAGQYTAFLNAKARTDVYGLYNARMDYDTNPTWYGCNIKRSGTSGSYSYSVSSDRANRPVNLVSFWDACRFVNWLNNGQGDGDTESGAYPLGGYNDINGESILRNADAKWWIPSEDEWYKAAYHDKRAGIVANYFDYPTGANVVPGRDMTEGTRAGNNANFSLNYPTSPIDSNTYYTTLAGEFELSTSPYGTFDQGGNVEEWNDTPIFAYVRGQRGGAYVSDSSDLQASIRPVNANIRPNLDLSFTGFRVASAPEPGTVAMLCAAGIGFLLWAWRRRYL